MNDDVPERFAEALKLGCVSSSDWQSYTWKNELFEQRRRIMLHLDEVFIDADTEHKHLIVAHDIFASDQLDCTRGDYARSARAHMRRCTHR